jgi:hypothetical protein
MSQALFDISIEKVHFYEKNPRSHHDPEAYAALKNSIREIGIKHPQLKSYSAQTVRNTSCPLEVTAA